MARRINDAIRAVGVLRAIEEEFGEGAALNLDYPFDQKLIRHGHRHPDRVDVARRRMMAEATAD